MRGAFFFSDMATKRTKMYRVKTAYLGKVKLESATKTTVLDELTPQAVLEKLYGTVLGKGFIELVATPVVAAQPQDNGKVG